MPSVFGSRPGFAIARPWHRDRPPTSASRTPFRPRTRRSRGPARNRTRCDWPGPGACAAVVWPALAWPQRGAVLVAVNALRSAPTARDARPSGIDGACAAIGFFAMAKPVNCRTHGRKLIWWTHSRPRAVARTCGVFGARTRRPNSACGSFCTGSVSGTGYIGRTCQVNQTLCFRRFTSVDI